MESPPRHSFGFMKRVIPLAVLAIPTLVMFLAMKFGIGYVISNSTDYSRIGVRIQKAIPFILMANHAVLAIGCVFALKFQKIPIAQLGIARPWKFGALGIVLGGLLFGLQALITLPLLNRFQLFEYWSGFPGIPFVLSATLFAGLIEELIFRGYGTVLLEKYEFGPMAIWFVTTIAFSAIHYGQGPAGIINAAVMGGILGFVYLSVRNLPLVISGHLFGNLFFIAYMVFRSPVLHV